MCYGAKLYNVLRCQAVQYATVPSCTMCYGAKLYNMLRCQAVQCVRCQAVQCATVPSCTMSRTTYTAYRHFKCYIKLYS